MRFLTWQELLFPTHLTYLALTLSAIKGDKDAWRKESGTIPLYWFQQRQCLMQHVLSVPAEDYKKILMQSFPSGLKVDLSSLAPWTPRIRYLLISTVNVSKWQIRSLCSKGLVPPAISRPWDDGRHLFGWVGALVSTWSKWPCVKCQSSQELWDFRVLAHRPHLRKVRFGQNGAVTNQNVWKSWACFDFIKGSTAESSQCDLASKPPTTKMWYFYLMSRIFASPPFLLFFVASFLMKLHGYLAFDLVVSTTCCLCLGLIQLYHRGSQRLWWLWGRLGTHMWGRYIHADVTAGCVK